MTVGIHSIDVFGVFFILPFVKDYPFIIFNEFGIFAILHLSEIKVILRHDTIIFKIGECKTKLL